MPLKWFNSSALRLSALAWLFTLSLSVSGPAYPQGGSLFSGGITVLSATGRPIGNATVTICAFGATGIPCSPTITVYTSPALGPTAANPDVTDGNGNLFKYAAPGRYTYTVTGSGIIGTSYTATVAGSGGGDVLLSGSNAFTGLNTDSQLHAFNGGITTTTLTATGAAALTGNVTATAGQNNICAQQMANILIVGCGKYPSTGAGLQLALADAITAGGTMTVDARSLSAAPGVTAASFSTEVDIGNGTVPVNLLLPISGNWVSNVSNGTSAGFKIFNLSSMTGSMCGAGIQFELLGSSTFNGTNVFVTDSLARYIHVSGFDVVLNAGGIVTSAIGEWKGQADNSISECITVANQQGVLANVPKVGYVHGFQCCQPKWRNMGFEGQNGSTLGIGSVPLTISDTGGSTTEPIFDSINLVHPCNGCSNLVITGNTTADVQFINGVYMEGPITGTGSDTTTAAIQITGNAGPIFFSHISDGADLAGSTRWLVDNAVGAKGLKIDSITPNIATTNCINDHVTGITITGCTLFVSKSYDSTLGTIAGAKSFTAGTVLPNVAGAAIIGTTALPVGTIQFGTAATNNLAITPAAFAAARILNVNDPLGTVALPYVIASGTTTLTANAALAAVTSQAANTTAATGVLTTDSIEWSFASAPTAGDNLCHVLPYVTAGNVNFVRTNPTAAAQNVSALVINWRVIR